jgi:GDPmannose 4,6-dehydratase
MKSALILGITGQDGSYLTEFLLEKKYSVWGMVRNLSSHKLNNLANTISRIKLIDGNILNVNSLRKAIKLSNPDEIYNFAGHSDIASSWDNISAVYKSVAIPPITIMDEILKSKKEMKFYQSSSSEMYGNINSYPQNEITSFYPRNPYGFSKLFAHWATVNFRNKYGIHAVSGILYNHESPRRSEKFVTKKIINSAIRIKYGLQKNIVLGNLDTQRDWGYAPEYVDAIWRMIQNNSPNDYVIGTGKLHSVREFCQITFEKLNLEYEQFIKIDKKLCRSFDESILVADSSKARKELSWEASTNLDQLIDIMINAEIKNY